MKKRKGQIAILIPLFVAIFILVLVSYSLQMHQYRSTKTLTEDALAASNLASAVIDTEEYGITHHIIIASPEYSYMLYQEALRINLNLDESWQSDNKAAIAGRVDILDYIIYNVRGNDIEVYSFGQNHYSTVIQNGLGSTRSPNGILIESTSVYSRITFPVEGIYDVKTTAVKDKLVDIVN